MFLPFILRSEGTSKKCRKTPLPCHLQGMLNLAEQRKGFSTFHLPPYQESHLRLCIINHVFTQLKKHLFLLPSVVISRLKYNKARAKPWHHIFEHHNHGICCLGYGTIYRISLEKQNNIFPYQFFFLLFFPSRWY